MMRAVGRMTMGALVIVGFAALAGARQEPEPGRAGAEVGTQDRPRLEAARKKARAAILKRALARRLEGVRVDRDLEYARVGDRSLRLDLYRPEGVAEGTRLPLVVWVHGGAWRAGSKDNTPAARLAAEHGYAVASIAYRLTDAATFPAQIADCKAAVRWLRAHAEEYGLDPDRVAAWGASAGGHLVALLGTAGDEAAWEDVGEHADQPSRVQAVVDYFGPTDFLAMDEQAGGRGAFRHDAADSPESLLIGGPIRENRDRAAAASPITYVTPDDPPFLIVHGTEDRLVPIGQSERLHEALRKAGVSVELIRVEGAGHGNFGPDSTPPGPEIFDRVRRFLDAQLKAPAPEG